MDWLEDPEIYSLYDLTRVNSGELFQLLRQIVSNGMKHIIHCEVLSQSLFSLMESDNLFISGYPSYAKPVVSYVKNAILPK